MLVLNVCHPALRFPLQTDNAHLHIKYSMGAGNRFRFESLMPDMEEVCVKYVLSVRSTAQPTPPRTGFPWPTLRSGLPSSPSSQQWNTTPAPSSPPCTGHTLPGLGPTWSQPPPPPSSTQPGAAGLSTSLEHVYYYLPQHSLPAPICTSGELVQG